MMPLGTIIATPQQHAAADRFADQQEAKRQAIGEKLLGHLERRIVGCEIRYYDGANRYAMMSRSNRTLWFERRADGDWYAAR